MGKLGGNYCDEVSKVSHRWKLGETINCSFPHLETWWKLPRWGFHTYGKLGGNYWGEVSKVSHPWKLGGNHKCIVSTSWKLHGNWSVVSHMCHDVETWGKLLMSRFQRVSTRFPFSGNLIFHPVLISLLFQHLSCQGIHRRLFGVVSSVFIYATILILNKASTDTQVLIQSVCNSFVCQNNQGIQSTQHKEQQLLLIIMIITELLISFWNIPKTWLTWYW